MAITKHKISEAERNAIFVKSTSGSRLTGTVTENKNVFDRYPELIRQKLNSLITEVALQGASSVGVSNIEGVVGTVVQDVLESLKSLIDKRYTKEQIDNLISNYSASTTTNKHIKNITLDSDTGVFKFIREDGTSISIDTALEKVTVNFRYEPSTQSLVLVDTVGQEQRVSLKDFITEYEFLDSDVISFTVDSSGKVSANIKDGSIPFTKFNQDFLNRLSALSDSALQAETNAKASEQNARTYRNQAETFSQNSKESEQQAKLYSDQAENHKNQAFSYANSCSESTETVINTRDEVLGYKTEVSTAKTDVLNAKTEIMNKIPVFHTRTLLASNWSNGTYSFSDLSGNLDLYLGEGATVQQYNAFANAKLLGSTTNNKIKALGTVPTIDIPIIIKEVK